MYTSPALTYVDSSFGQSTYFKTLNENMKFKIKSRMLTLASKGILGNVEARLLSPFVGVGTLLASVILRICSIIEPIIGFFADIGAAIVFRNVAPLKNLGYRCLYIIIHPIAALVHIPLDIVRIGLGVTVGALFAPKTIYHRLTNNWI